MLFFHVQVCFAAGLIFLLTYPYVFRQVKSSLCVHTRLGENFDEKALHSIVHATLKAVVAQFSANEIITQREV